MNAFERHGIEHLSPSTLNQFIACPAAFVLSKVLKRQSAVGAAAHRGTAVETGVVHGLLDKGASLADCVKKAQEQFGILTAVSGDSRLEKERDAIAGFVEQGLMALKPLGQVASTQQRVELKVDGIEVPIIGYYDLKFTSGALVDLKTTHALPSSPKAPHLKQVAFYMISDNVADGRLAYVTSKKAAIYPVENPKDQITGYLKAAKAVQKFLSISSDPMELASFVVPDVDSFYFDDPITRSVVKDIWGI
jgi:hypothetical protein